MIHYSFSTHRVITHHSAFSYSGTVKNKITLVEGLMRSNNNKDKSNYVSKRLDSINNLHMHVGFFFLHFWYLSVHDFVRLRSCFTKMCASGFHWLLEPWAVLLVTGLLLKNRSRNALYCLERLIVQYNTNLT